MCLKLLSPDTLYFMLYFVFELQVPSYIYLHIEATNPVYLEAENTLSNCENWCKLNRFKSNFKLINCSEMMYELDSLEIHWILADQDRHPKVRRLNIHIGNLYKYCIIGNKFRQMYNESTSLWNKISYLYYVLPISIIKVSRYMFWMLLITNISLF